MSYLKMKIGDFAHVLGGKRLPKGEMYCENVTEHPYVRVLDFHEKSVRLDNLCYISDNTFNKIINGVRRRKMLLW